MIEAPAPSRSEPQTFAPRWTKKVAGKVWHCTNLLDRENRLVGFVRYSFDGWDGYVTTGKKWPDGERWIDNLGRRTFWQARRAVEHAIRRELGEVSF